MNAPNKYSAWGDDGETAHTFIAGTEPPDPRQHGELVLVKVFEAESWNDACSQYHDWQGWAPYIPFSTEPDE